MQAITIRPALPSDSSHVARLIYLTMGIEADWLFGQAKGHPTHQVLTELSAHKKNRVSFSLAYMAERDGQIMGLLLAYPGRMLSQLDRQTGWDILRLLGLTTFIHLARSQSAYDDLIEAKADEFYISNLAVFPDFEGQGVGSRLMGHAEELARASGLLKCALIVSFVHEKARQLYERLGYKVISTYQSTHPKVAEGSGGYHRMVKPLDP
jgi:ribosomal protein S18 acetylase RimI-like enzyme